MISAHLANFLMNQFDSIKKLERLVINNQGEHQIFPWVVPLITTLPKS
jgi:hypothetical protein